MQNLIPPQARAAANAKSIQWLEDILAKHGEPKLEVNHVEEWKQLKERTEKEGKELTAAVLYPVFGVLTIQKISQAFYDNVWADDQEWFKKQFTSSNQEMAILNQWTFFTEKMGGPKVFEAWRNKGGEALVSFTHYQFTMTSASLNRWMNHMKSAVEKVGIKSEVPEATELFLDWCQTFGNHMITQKSMLFGKSL
eukprot:TRINITY_DN5924_c0_g1_i2.p1 TRINITY_DN5924_c0_g1~~TRINITY_DN5924_c0_g1_i2.p1  ORF type:complete len:195 (-),score=38.68 TRINITY_DN5924_c0_g1_i2:238-822(-)